MPRKRGRCAIQSFSGSTGALFDAAGAGGGAAVMTSELIRLLASGAAAGLTMVAVPAPLLVSVFVSPFVSVFVSVFVSLLAAGAGKDLAAAAAASRDASVAGRGRGSGGTSVRPALGAVRDTGGRAGGASKPAPIGAPMGSSRSAAP